MLHIVYIYWLPVQSVVAWVAVHVVYKLVSYTVYQV